eukprot:gnl/MRDRNA2_/MRDRNA2_85128_c0_seq5.p1 gnl/MRDRNA2_/MRDRNA2_85128_c0~~gnl/MRDRNA2_/MRDRNA2_85128_c0_seq5.p1  ORF type:complete len:423 (-),score=79.49 gnl/MRDRNA2_/MRDRNA2_85128_c0_seq5:6-1274(-)
MLSGALDVGDLGVLLMPYEISRQSLQEARLWHLISQNTPVRRDVQEILAGCTGGIRNAAAWVGKVCPELAGAQVSRHGGHAQHKLAMLVQHVEAVLERGPGIAARLLDHMVSFSGKKGNYWLKVAADVKAKVIDLVLLRAGSPAHRRRFEFGAYVGYSGLRFSGAMDSTPISSEGWCVTSCEVEPLHVCIARHMISLGERSWLAEVLSGQVRDLLPRIAGDFGELSAGFAFMDHRGTRFHEDFGFLEVQGMLGCKMDVIADNVLHPGAPVFLWDETRPAVERVATVWSVPEFGEFTDTFIEDWMALEVYVQRRKKKDSIEKNRRSGRASSRGVRGCLMFNDDERALKHFVDQYLVENRAQELRRQASKGDPVAKELLQKEFSEAELRKLQPDYPDADERLRARDLGRTLGVELRGLYGFCHA